jgi:hypothetical protein
MVTKIYERMEIFELFQETFDSALINAHPPNDCTCVPDLYESIVEVDINSRTCQDFK